MKKLLSLLAALALCATAQAQTKSENVAASVKDVTATNKTFVGLDPLAILTAGLIDLDGNLVLKATTSGGLVFEGATKDAHELTVTVPDVTADRTAALVLSTAEVVTATNVITASETGSTFFLNSATEFVSTLPAPAAGLRFTFIVTAAPVGSSYTVVTASSANVIVGNQNSVAGDAGDSGSTDDTVTFVAGSSVAGDRIECYSDGTNWFIYAVSRVAAGITFTTAS
jgi:hypothetical protein